MTEDLGFEAANLTYEDDTSADTFAYDRYDYDISKDDDQREPNKVAIADTKATTKR